jgi:hypothetical protein
MRVIARDPETQRDSPEEERTIVVVTDVAASPSIGTAPLTVSAPEAGASFNGPLPIAGTATPGTAVVATAVLTRPPTPTFAIVDPAGAAVEFDVQAPSPPEPLTLTADAAGAITGALALPPGAWDVTFTPAAGDAVTRSITVGQAAGLTVALTIDGGDSWMELAEDGEPVEGFAGGLAEDGSTIELAAETELRVRAGNAGAVAVTVNGVSIGRMGAAGAVVEWSITRAGT